MPQIINAQIGRKSATGAIQTGIFFRSLAAITQGATGLGGSTFSISGGADTGATGADSVAATTAVSVDSL